MGIFRKKAPSKEAFGAYSTRALVSSLTAPSTQALAGFTLSATDGILAGYWQDDVDWRRVWSAVAAHHPDVPPFGIRTYWPGGGPGNALVPIGAIAFMSATARLRVARDPATAETLLAIMAGRANGHPDPDPRVSAAAEQNR